MGPRRGNARLGGGALPGGAAAAGGLGDGAGPRGTMAVVARRPVVGRRLHRRGKSLGPRVSPPASPAAAVARVSLVWNPSSYPPLRFGEGGTKRGLPLGRKDVGGMETGYFGGMVGRQHAEVDWPAGLA